MRKFALATLVVAAVFAVVPAVADGPSGSTEHYTDEAGNVIYTNDIDCGSGEATPAGVVYAADDGVEVCTSGELPVQGRLIVTTDDGGYIAADGDKDNPEQAQGWVRIDQNGLRCGDSDGDLDATHPSAADTQEDCG